MSEQEYEHNRCDICNKKFKTALGFHRHYIFCIDKRLTKGDNGN